jgi:hypothetical protein
LALAAQREQHLFLAAVDQAVIPLLLDLQRLAEAAAVHIAVDHLAEDLAAGAQTILARARVEQQGRGTQAATVALMLIAHPHKVGVGVVAQVQLVPHRLQ